MKFDTLRVGSKTYNKVTIVGANASDLYFTYEHGITNIKLKYLDPALQRKFNYDPKAADAAERQRDTDDAMYSLTLASNIAARVKEAARVAKKAASSSEDNIADAVSGQSLLGKPAPAFTVEKWLGEKPSMTDKFVLVAFWAPWSVPSRNSLPSLSNLQKRFPEKLVVVGLTSDTQAEVEAMTDARIDFASAIDTQGRMLSNSGASSIPYVLLLDPKGIVRYQGHPAAITPEKLQQLMAKASEETLK